MSHPSLAAVLVTALALFAAMAVHHELQGMHTLLVKVTTYMLTAAQMVTTLVLVAAMIVQH